MQNKTNWSGLRTAGEPDPVEEMGACRAKQSQFAGSRPDANCLYAKGLWGEDARDAFAKTNPIVDLYRPGVGRKEVLAGSAPNYPSSLINAGELAVAGGRRMW